MLEKKYIFATAPVYGGSSRCVTVIIGFFHSGESLHPVGISIFVLFLDCVFRFLFHPCLLSFRC